MRLGITIKVRGGMKLLGSIKVEKWHVDGGFQRSLQKAP
jgi:hypothetical protein